MVAASAVAEMAAQALSAAAEEPPPPLPPGWLLKESRSQPGVFYYYEQETGQSSWDPPQIQMQQEEQIPKEKEEEESAAVKAEMASSGGGSSGKRSRDVVKQEDEDQKPAKKQRETPKEVRVLHILKKHRDSKRPSSWRSKNKPITISREEAQEELEGLLEILREEQDNPENLIATFKELASQESDCSSAKRKGDLGMFGRKKMRPEFEEAAFSLDINQLSSIVETSSGLHILLRLE